MIIKRAADRKESSSGRLVDYIQRALDYMQRKNTKEEDRPEVFTGNCLTQDIELCKLEMSFTQKQNHRAKGDKTYHMIISFSPEDDLTTELHKKVVADVCKDLGFGEHQRVCAVHKDTNNEHCHVVINKIHPKTFKMMDPYYDKFKMNEIAAELEQKYSLSVINHSNEKSTNKLNNKLHYDGMKSFSQWVVDNVKIEIEEKIKEGVKWKEVVELLAKYNLHVRKRGNGLVISDKDKPLFIKASSVTTSFKSLGPYNEFLVSPNVPDAVKYERVPLTGDNELWQKHQESKEANKAAKEAVYEKYKVLRADVYRAAKLQRLDIKHNIFLKGPLKREQSKNITDAVSAKLADLNADREEELAKHKSGNWLDFLVKQYDENGNIEALKQLKKSKIFNPKFQNQVSGKEESTELFSRVDNTGTSYEQVGKKRIFLVDGKLQTQSDDIAVAGRALDIALQNFEAPLVVDGSKAFIKAIQLAAQIKGVEVTTAGKEVKPEQNQKDIEI